MIRYYARQEGRLAELDQPEAGCWINLSPPFSPDEVTNFAEQYNLSEDFLTDSLDIDERSRYERDEDVRFILVSTPVLNENSESENESVYLTVPIGILLTLDHVITVSAFETSILELFLENRIRAFEPLERERFVLQIMEQNVMRYLSCLKKLNIRRNRIEKDLMNSSNNSDLKQLLSIEKSLVYFVNALNANELLKMKMRRTDFLRINDDEDLSDLFEDIIIDNGQALSMSNVYTNILNGTMDAYSSIISNNLNAFVNRLTIVTVSLSVPTLIASFFGMNIPHGLPERPTTFYGLMIFSIVFTALLTWWFVTRRRLF